MHVICIYTLCVGRVHIVYIIWNYVSRALSLSFSLSLSLYIYIYIHGKDIVDTNIVCICILRVFYI